MWKNKKKRSCKKKKKIKIKKIQVLTYTSLANAIFGILHWVWSKYLRTWYLVPRSGNNNKHHYPSSNLQRKLQMESLTKWDHCFDIHSLPRNSLAVFGGTCRLPLYLSNAFPHLVKASSKVEPTVIINFSSVSSFGIDCQCKRRELFEIVMNIDDYLMKSITLTLAINPKLTRDLSASTSVLATMKWLRGLTMTTAS